MQDSQSQQFDPVQTAIQILKYAKQHNISIQKSCEIHGKHSKYVADIKSRKDRYSNNPLFQSFIVLHDDFVNGKIKSIQNEVEELTISIPNNESNNNSDSDPEVETSENISWDESSDTAQVTLKLANVEINNLEEALAYSKVDLNVWEVERHIFNTWTTSAKLLKTEGFQKITNIQVKVWFRRKIKDAITWSNFVDEITKYAPDYTQYKADLISKYDGLTAKKYSLEVSIPDLHIGKLAWEDEVGENFDTKIAIQRYNESIDKLLANVVHLKGSIEEIVLPVGNDMINIDNKHNTTTAGTPQSVDSRWQQMFWKAKELLIHNIDKLSVIAPVKVLVVPGNHDQQTMFYLGDTLKSWYRTSTRVQVNNEPTRQKIYTYGTNLVMFTHGNEEKHNELGLIIATDHAQLWAAAKYREVHLGHYHSRKSIKYIDLQEFQGFRVRILPSLSGTDEWHKSKGYISIKSAVAFLYDKDNGLVAEYSHNVL